MSKSEVKRLTKTESALIDYLREGNISEEDLSDIENSNLRKLISNCVHTYKFDIPKKLKDVILSGKSIIITGDCGVGKTTLQEEILSKFLFNERIFIIENFKELQVKDLKVKEVIETRKSITLSDIETIKALKKPPVFVFNEFSHSENMSSFQYVVSKKIRFIGTIQNLELCLSEMNILNVDEFLRNNDIALIELDKKRNISIK